MLDCVPFSAIASKIQLKHSKNKKVPFQQLHNEQTIPNGNLQRFERIHDHGFNCKKEILCEFLTKLKLKQGTKVLDVGCGMGLVDFYMAEKYNAHVLGIDRSHFILKAAKEKKQRLPYQKLAITFDVCDVIKKEYPEESFDVIYSSDQILNVRDKNHLFTKFIKWLKPGGKLLISDYCCGDQHNDISEQFSSYLALQKYHLLSIQQYANVLAQTGFVNVVAEDRSNDFIPYLQNEIQHLLLKRNDYLGDVASLKDLEQVIQTWKTKLHYLEQEEHKWSFFMATKSLH